MLEFDNQEKDPLTNQIIAAAIEVHRHLGVGFLEKVYQEALAIEFSSRGIPYNKEVTLPIFYKGIKLPTIYRADFVCFDSVIVELKALEQLSGIEGPQVLHYLKATGLHTALLLNFGCIKKLDIKRFVA